MPSLQAARELKVATVMDGYELSADGSALQRPGEVRSVCEVLQLADVPTVVGDATVHAVAPEIADACAHVPGPLPGAGAGYCWTTDASLLAPECKRLGSQGTLRLEGQELKESDLFMVCRSR